MNQRTLKIARAVCAGSLAVFVRVRRSVTGADSGTCGTRRSDASHA